MCHTHHLSLTVAVHGDIYETRCLDFVWFRETQTLFEFYGNQHSLRQKLDRVSWFPKELPEDDPWYLYAFFKKLSGSILWNYIHHPEHILSVRWKNAGIGKFSYLDTYCPNPATNQLLMRNICKIIIASVIHLQSYANKNNRLRIH